MPANGWWRRLQGKCNRDIPPTLSVRVERCGKSAPAAWQLVRHVNPIRCKIDEGYGWLARLRNRLSCLATGRLDRWLFTTELGLQSALIYIKDPPLQVGLLFTLSEELAQKIGGFENIARRVSAHFTLNGQEALIADLTKRIQIGGERNLAFT